MAELYEFGSIAFPAIGTGNIRVRHLPGDWSIPSLNLLISMNGYMFAGEKTVREDTMATMMLDSIAEFADTKPKYIKLVRIIIYQEKPHILDTFRTVIHDKAKGMKKISWWTTFKAKFKGERVGWGCTVDYWYIPGYRVDRATVIYVLFYCYIGGSKDSSGVTPPEVVGDVSVLPPSPPHIVLCVCGVTQATLDTVIREIDRLCVEESKDMVLDSPQDQDSIKQLGDEQVREQTHTILLRNGKL